MRCVAEHRAKRSPLEAPGLLDHGERPRDHAYRCRATVPRVTDRRMTIGASSAFAAPKQLSFHHGRLRISMSEL